MSDDKKPESSFAKGMGIGVGIFLSFVLAVFALLLAVAVINAIRESQGEPPIPLNWNLHLGLTPSGNWTFQGPSDICAGKPPNVVFQCRSPSSGEVVPCYCGK